MGSLEIAPDFLSLTYDQPREEVVVKMKRKIGGHSSSHLRLGNKIHRIEVSQSMI